MPSHSNSFGNNAEKDTAGCRAFYRKSIVIGVKYDWKSIYLFFCFDIGFFFEHFFP